MASTAVCSTPSMILSLPVFCLVLCTACYLIYDSVRKIREQRTSAYQELVSWLYEDEDGIATAESQKQQASPVIKWVATSIALSGFFITFSLALLTTLSVVPCWQAILSTWLTFAAWVCWITLLASQLLTNSLGDALPFSCAYHVTTQSPKTISVWLALRNRLIRCFYTGLVSHVRKSSRIWEYFEAR